MQTEKLPDIKWRTEYFEKFNERYPAGTAGVLGKSILGRDIHYFKLGSGERHVLAVGAHHAMEHATSSALYGFIDFLCENEARGATCFGVDVRFLLQKFAFWVVPCLNPDGVEIHLNGLCGSPLSERQRRMNGGEDFSRWQANARGVDLNHNYDAGFAAYKRIEEREEILPGRTRFSGEYPESEPETRALANFTRALAPSLVVSFHTQGEEIYSKPQCDRIRRMSERASRAVGYKSVIAEGHAAYGGFCDYTGGVLGIPSFTIELGKGENPLPESSLPVILAATRKLLILLPTYL